MNEENEILDHELQVTLQRYFDADLSREEAEKFRNLIEQKPKLKQYMLVLSIMRRYVCWAEESAWMDFPKLSARQIAEAAETATFDELSLEQLAPLLERYVDHELTSTEERIVEDLAASRNDVADYIATLQWTSSEIKKTCVAFFNCDENNDIQDLDSLSQNVDFSNFWNEVQKKIPEKTPVVSDSYDESSESNPLDNVVLFYDNELHGDELRRTSSLLQGVDQNENRDAIRLYNSLKFEGACINAASEEALKNVDFENYFSNLEFRLNNSASNSLIDYKQTKQPTSPLPQAKNDNFFHRYRQGFAGAIAATLVLGVAALVYFAAMKPQQTIINKTVVFVEDVKYAPGFTGEVVNPVQQVSSNGDTTADSDADSAPTVIWVYDKDNESKDKEPDKKDTEIKIKEEKNKGVSI